MLYIFRFFSLREERGEHSHFPLFLRYIVPVFSPVVIVLVVVVVDVSPPGLPPFLPRLLISLLANPSLLSETRVSLGTKYRRMPLLLPCDAYEKSLERDRSIDQSRSISMRRPGSPLYAAKYADIRLLVESSSVLGMVPYREQASR